MTRIAISPRFAINIFLNIRFYGEQPLAVLHRLAVIDVDLDDLAVVFRIDLVHQLHGFDDAEDLPFLHRGTDIDERWGSWLSRPEERADDRRFHDGKIDFVGGRGLWSRNGFQGRRGRSRRWLLRLCNRLNHRHRERHRGVRPRLLDPDLESLALEL